MMPVSPFAAWKEVMLPCAPGPRAQAPAGQASVPGGVPWGGAEGRGFWGSWGDGGFCRRFFGLSCSLGFLYLHRYFWSAVLPRNVSSCTFSSFLPQSCSQFPPTTVAQGSLRLGLRSDTVHADALVPSLLLAKLCQLA